MPKFLIFSVIYMMIERQKKAAHRSKQFTSLNRNTVIDSLWTIQPQNRNITSSLCKQGVKNLVVLVARWVTIQVCFLFTTVYKRL